MYGKNASYCSATTAVSQHPNAASRPPVPPEAAEPFDAMTRPPIPPEAAEPFEAMTRPPVPLEPTITIGFESS